jgi:hypothetical protein
MLSARKLKQLLSYDPTTGEWKWLIKPSVRTKVGDRAGHLDLTGWRIHIKGNKYLLSRLAFLYMTGKMPKRLVDFKDRDVSNCRWDNLREATRSQDQQNSVRKNLYGKGVSWRPGCKNQFQARITINKGERILLGSFDSAEKAAKAYKDAAKKYHGEFARV